MIFGGHGSLLVAAESLTLAGASERSEKGNRMASDN